MAALPQQKLAAWRTRALQRFRISCPHPRAAACSTHPSCASTDSPPPPHAPPARPTRQRPSAKAADVCGKINLSLEHLRGVVVRRVMGSFFEHGAPAAPSPTEDAARRRKGWGKKSPKKQKKDGDGGVAEARASLERTASVGGGGDMAEAGSGLERRASADGDGGMAEAGADLDREASTDGDGGVAVAGAGLEREASAAPCGGGCVAVGGPENEAGCRHSGHIPGGNCALENGREAEGTMYVSRCQLGGEEHMAWSDADAPIALVEPIPQTGTPLHGTHGCVYCSDTSPDGWISLELDGSGRDHPYSLAFFLSHSRKVQVNTRIKSEHAFSHADAEYVTKNSSGMLQLAVKVLLDHWKCTHAATLAAGGVGEGVKSTRDHDGDGNESGGSHVEESDEDGSDTETYRAVRTQLRRGPKDGESPASRAGVQVGDEITQVQGHCVSSEPFSGVVRRLTGLPCDVSITLRMMRHGLGEYDATFVKLYDGGLCMEVEAAGGGCGARVQALYLKPTGLHRELAYQLYWMTNPQCEVTQWITTRSLPVLKVFLTEYRSSQKVYASTSERLRSDGLRISISRLIDEARARVLGFPGKYTLHPAALALLDGALERAEEVTASLSRIPRREALSSISSESRPVYDPSTGVAYHFTKKGERLFWFPDFKTKSEPKSSVANQIG